MDRVAIFCDSANLYHGMTRLFPARRVDYGKLFAKVVGPDRKLIRVYWYTGVPVAEPQATEKQRFLAYLQGSQSLDLRQHCDISVNMDATWLDGILGPPVPPSSSVA